MPTLTSQIIKAVVSEEVKYSTSVLQSEMSEVRKEIKTLEKKFDLKFDTVIEQLTDLAGKFNKFDEEQTVLSGQMSDRTDRIEKLEVATFGVAAI
ncbi:MAG: hypothetical protein UU93_C0006G0033 [Candidatus Amesbacteria bacterium GW2011_GWA2_42_12]|uniref:Uncharacterized protein n=1 Tax=Candidatus Amesbacteria bacterium GW2011_GWA2_42_12 TaxID=1618356 RepID=A0A0G0Y739_9BACT|nr:MAG: hypothetical protein UU93_C0006G0033 [Candidatus Amesbacteria bacterium GW2011_GWA2_42_12]